MTQDTRKDRRVKIVSLNVRYKSATVDEFIENHAHDVSRGGIYIKTGNPFPPGTLLKFEIRLASDQAVIAGVGRVVWKRDAGTANGERPAGMGVKFIKIDEPSKGVIDKLVNTKADAGSAYESEVESPDVGGGGEPPPKPAPAPAPAVQAATPAPKLTPMGGMAVAVPRKATMMGIGALGASSAPGAPSAPPAPAASASPGPAATPAASGGGMFPVTKSEAEMPPKQEQTVMKQAAELLEEALREAGGSMEEIGHNPLFTGSAEAKPEAKVEAKAPSTPPPAEEPKKKQSGRPPAEGSTTEDEAAKARAMVAEMSPAPKKSASEPPPRTARDTPVAKRSSDAPAARASDAPAKKGGSSGFVALFLAIVVVAGVVVMFRDKLFGTGETPPPTPTVVAPPTPATVAPPTPASASAAPTDTTSAAASASAAPSAMPSASASASASAKPTGNVGAHPPPTATAVPTATAAPTATATATAAPTATATATAAPTPKPTATAPPPPKPKPAKPADDNPY